MIARLPLILVFSFLALPAEPQSVIIQPNSIAVAESQYREAQDAWLHNDPTLANELFTGRKDEIRGRIHRAASLRDDVMAKKDVYLGFIIQRLDESRKRLDDYKPGSTLPVDDLKKGLEQQQAGILSDQDRLEGLLRDLPEGDEYSLVRRELERERTDLITLQNNVAQRIRSLENVRKAQDAIGGQPDKDPLVEKLDSIISIWQQERERTVKQRSSWAHLYNTMEQAIDKTAAPSPPAKAAPPVKTSREKSEVVAPRAPASAALTSPPRSLNGQWIYRSQPGAWAGVAEPASAELEIHAEGGRVEGLYSARVPVHGETRNLSLSLQGNSTEPGHASIRWTSQEPVAHGELTLALSPDGRLFVEILTSDDSYVPRGMEVLLPR